MTISGDSLVEAVEAVAIDGVSDGNKKRPYLVFCSANASGHTFPLIQIAAEMIQRGFEATFITGEEFHPQIKRMGAEHVVVPELMAPDVMEARSKIPAGTPRLQYDMDHFFIRPIPTVHKILVSTLESVRERRPNQQVIIVHETFFMGLTPLMYGAPLPRGYPVRPPVIDINVTPIIVGSIDTGPFGPALPPDSTPSGRARNQLLNQMFFGPAGPFGPANQQYTETLRLLGAHDEVTANFFEACQTCYDVTLQMCSENLEYPRSDLHATIKYAGCLPPKPIDPNYKYPEWWGDVTSGTKKVIGVGQGTVAMDYTDLVIPAIKGLADREDVVVVAILGARGAELPADLEIPANTRVVDYLHYDALLKYTDVWVMNAGYGGFIHGIANGVPMVLGGDSEDKPEVAARGEWAGVAHNLKTGRPTPEQVAAGVEAVLANDRYKKRVVEIQKENEELKVLDVIERHIWQYADSA
ncbi:UDP-glucosyltransferase B1 [Colletotrichum sidae]|uniref:UDP-glucosyltransferase B1 n=1 Tax=Colletotrichum sidae TaxID=1347389 RepID=A0A4R8TRY1_9PEZI|nr:UDP-glucosyltransferase B1 [Colletotrichum sidae]